ncbi:dehydrogenase/reductase SDR family member 7 isoform X2 [Ambystoma mexicanum]|uniref:dehydrogenase/reductase SDR family member 7 isoform X2 n=1 Tax=Ambystoma mexicanum TaxID=8296 RepID=UPI0037E7C76E
MEMCCVCSLLWWCALLYAALQLIRFLRADADLALLWAELFGAAPEREFSGKVVWVTGASSGIGEELAYRLAKLGASVVLSARRENELQRVKKKCLEISLLEDRDVLVLPLDLVKMDSHEPATKAVLQHFGRIDILVNNGGQSQRSLFIDTNLEVYEALIKLNYLGTVSLTKWVLHHMIERKKGKIVTVSSATGLIGVPLSSGYAASKHALQGFFNSLRIELGEYPEITVSTICPGPVQSKIVDNALTEEIHKTPMSTDQSYKMPTARCVHLMLIAIANNLKESWISDQPFLSIFYLWQYSPTWAWWITEKIGRKRIMNFKSGLDADSSYFTQKTKTS